MDAWHGSAISHHDQQLINRLLTHLDLYCLITCAHNQVRLTSLLLRCDDISYIQQLERQERENAQHLQIARSNQVWQQLNIHESEALSSPLSNRAL